MSKGKKKIDRPPTWTSEQERALEQEAKRMFDQFNEDMREKFKGTRPSYFMTEVEFPLYMHEKIERTAYTSDAENEGRKASVSKARGYLRTIYEALEKLGPSPEIDLIAMNMGMLFAEGSSLGNYTRVVYQSRERAALSRQNRRVGKSGGDSTGKRNVDDADARWRIKGLQIAKAYVEDGKRDGLNGGKGPTALQIATLIKDKVSGAPEVETIQPQVGRWRQSGQLPPWGV